MKKIIYLLCLVGMISSCGTTKKQVEQQPAVSIQFNADSAYQFCAAQCQFGPRTMNSEAHEQCAQWIAQKFQQYGYQVELQKADLKGYDGTILKSTNIIAKQPTANSQKATARIFICAHWDSRPWADNDPDSANWRKPVIAANDGASGVAVMLELARLIQQHDSLNVAVDFICFDAEDWGIPQWDETGDGTDSWALGAQYWAKSQRLRVGEQSSGMRSTTYQYAILLDMVGGQGAKFYQEGYSLQKAGQIVEKVWRAASAAGYGSTFPMKEGGGVTDDHVPVNDIANIPCIDIINYYPDCPQSSFGPTWHTVNDDMQHIDKNTLQAVGQTLLQVIYNE
ncbi:MAG: M28 family peptidase [Prevotella sp.]|nr:M28 family peptidase [Prevotella sp.]